MKRLKICLWVITGTAPVFDEVVASYRWALSALGHIVSVSYQPMDGADLTLAIGANWLPPQSKIPADTVILNFEQRTTWRPHMLDLYRGHKVWNYDPVVQERFVDAGLGCSLVNFAWTPALDAYRSLPRTEEIDLVFVGSMYPERVRRIALLEEAGLRVVASQHLWGVERARVMARSKVVLSLRSEDDSPFMSVRIYPVWAMGKPVLSETFVGREHHPGIEQALALFDSDDDALVEAALSLCHDGPRRAALAAAGTAYAKAHPMLPAIEQALAAL